MSTVTFVMTLFTSGCATKPTSLYQSWGNQLAGVGQYGKTVSDVSLLLGVEPYKCENVESKPMIGILIKDDDGVIVKGIQPNGPAATAGIKTGDKVLSVNGKRVFSSLELMNLIRSEANPNKSLLIETNRETVTLRPMYPIETTQCYWEIVAGEVQKVSGGAYGNRYGGFASHGGTSYKRFFRTSCRFVDGIASECRSNWQE